jgi:hypothetical protein
MSGAVAISKIQGPFALSAVEVQPLSSMAFDFAQAERMFGKRVASA